MNNTRIVQNFYVNVAKILGLEKKQENIAVSLKIKQYGTEVLRKTVDA